MAFTDPQTITIDGVAHNCALIKSDGSKSIYKAADANHTITISHQASKGRVRSMARVDERVVAADPLTAVNQYATTAVYLVVDRPEVGFSADDIDDIVVGFKTWLSTANVTKLVGLEH